MARKSRRKNNQNSEAEQNKITPSFVVKDELVEKTAVLATAAYVRLSVENSGHDTDDSIKTQIALVESFIKSKSDLILVETYVDNGFSGTRFDRPEFVRMMDDAKSGRIQCIVVKDLSRFGRDYLETGYYLESIFPLLNIRFIAITDQYDSNRPGDRNSISVPIKNMVNAMYAKDYSRKQEAFREMCRKTGRVMGNYKPYGYTFSKNKRRFEIDETVAPYVRMVFAWSLMGVSRLEVAKRMNIVGAPTPREYELNQQPQRKWKDSTVKQIIYNPVYAGFYVMGKRVSSLYKGIPQMNVERDKWLLFPNYHEPYITMDEYRALEDLVKKNKADRDEQLKVREAVREERKDIFKGKVFCADCGRQMNYVRGCHHRGYDDISFQYYRCRYNKNYPECNNRKIQQNFLKIVVMDQIKSLAKVAVDKGNLLKKLQKEFETGDSISFMDRNVSRLKEKESLISDKILKAYSDFAESLLTDEEYAAVKAKLLSEKDATTAKRIELEAKIVSTKRAIARFEELSEKLNRYVNDTECSEGLVAELINRITVSDDTRIEINFSCGDVFRDALIDEFIAEAQKERGV